MIIRKCSMSSLFPWIFIPFDRVISPSNRWIGLGWSLIFFIRLKILINMINNVFLFYFFCFLGSVWVSRANKHGVWESGIKSNWIESLSYWIRYWFHATSPLWNHFSYFQFSTFIFLRLCCNQGFVLLANTVMFLGIAVKKWRV
jgi:hypothetical protein